MKNTFENIQNYIQHILENYSEMSHAFIIFHIFIFT